jgi:hypothetical protein
VVLIKDNGFEPFQLLQNSGPGFKQSMRRIFNGMMMDDETPRMVEGDQICVRGGHRGVPLEFRGSSQAGNGTNPFFANGI